MATFFLCDESFERDGHKRCCVMSAEQPDAMPEPDEGSLRCKPHGQLVGLQPPIYARTRESALAFVRGRDN